MTGLERFFWCSLAFLAGMILVFDVEKFWPYLFAIIFVGVGVELNVISRSMKRGN